jgi:signal transduction histidine kinase
VLWVRDDGGGFDVYWVRRRAGAAGSLGVLGMEERVALVGGSFELRSLPGKGTVMLATFPLTAADRQKAA